MALGRIPNRDDLLDHGDVDPRRRALSVVEGALDAVQPERLFADRVALADDGTTLAIDGERIDIADLDSVTVVGAGKGSRRVVEALLERIGPAVAGGIVVEKHGQGGSLPGIEVREAGHPVPDADSRAAGTAVLETAAAAGPDDLVLFCITGGASALLAAPADGLDLDDLRTVTDALLSAGAPIEDLNAVRKHLSAIKGGRLASRTAPARAVTFVVVDEVAGEPWGPTVPDPTTFDDALAALERHGVAGTVPAAVRDHLARGAADPDMETPDAAALSSRPHRVVTLADATDLCDSAVAAAEAAGLDAVVLSAVIEGESREVGTVLAGIAREVVERRRPVEPPCALISGGETTVTLVDPDTAGTGGPNQELAVSAARRLAGLEGLALAAIDSDGTDGPTDCAGGLVDGTTAARATDRDVDLVRALDRNDAGTALDALDDAVRLDETGTNLMDLRVLVVIE